MHIKELKILYIVYMIAPHFKTFQVYLIRFGQQIRYTWKVLKCGAGEGWKRSVGPIM